MGQNSEKSSDSHFGLKRTCFRARKGQEDVIQDITEVFKVTIRKISMGRFWRGQLKILDSNGRGQLRHKWDKKIKNKEYRVNEFIEVHHVSEEIKSLNKGQLRNNLI